MAITSIKALNEKMASQIIRDKEHCAKALLRIYKEQTTSEKADRDVKFRNNVGFIPADAKLLSGISKWLIEGKPFTDKQFEAVKKHIVKYAGQLVRLSIQNGLIRKEGKEYIH